jgi:hypothetical protein
MSLASRIARVQYSKKETTWATLPGASGARTLRRTRFSFNPVKDRYDTNEVRSDQQKNHARFGAFRVEGTLEGELSCGSYQPEFEALLRAAAAATASITGMTIDVAGAGPTYTFTRAAGSWISDGVRVGMVVRFTAGLNAGTLNRNIAVVGLTTTILTGFPLDLLPVTTETSVSSVTAVVPGKRIVFPSSGHTEDSFTVEDQIKSDVFRVHHGVECNTLAISLAPNQVGTFSMGCLGQSTTTSNAGYYTTPSAPTTSPVLDGVLATILVDGSPIVIADQLQINTSGGLSTKPVIGTRATPAIFQGVFEGSGTMRTFIEDTTFYDHFDLEDEYEILTVLYETSAANSDFMAFHMPSCKLSRADTVDDDPPQINIPFDFRRKSAATGYDETTFSLQDSRYA